MNKPEKKFSSGGVTASIWMQHLPAKDGKAEVSFPTISFDRRYKDKDGEWKSTNSLRLSEIPKAIMVLGKAYEHLALKTVNPKHNEMVV